MTDLASLTFDYLLVTSLDPPAELSGRLPVWVVPAGKTIFIEQG